MSWWLILLGWMLAGPVGFGVAAALDSVLAMPARYSAGPLQRAGDWCHVRVPYLAQTAVILIYLPWILLGQIAACWRRLWALP